MKDARMRSNFFWHSHHAWAHAPHNSHMNETGMSAEFAEQHVINVHEMDFNPNLNTSSYVNVVLEPEEQSIALKGLVTNIADSSVYPESQKLHDRLVNQVANLWNCPMDPDSIPESSQRLTEVDPDELYQHSGACTVGSTEATLLGGLCLKFRWRKWFMEKNNLTKAEVRREYPNIVISSCYQACWEKLFKYCDIEPRIVQPSYKTFTITPEAVREKIDDHTIGVVCILGNHYGGHYDPVWEINEMLTALNEEMGWQVGIHVDAASGGFLAPFQQEVPAWDFRCENVLSISASGHKYGQSSCGTGWIVWRRRQDLSEHVAITVTYLGGRNDSYTLNFSRPATGIYVQAYKFLRLGLSGYGELCSTLMQNTAYIRARIASMKIEDIPIFEILDAGDEGCLPVMACFFSPAVRELDGLNFNEIEYCHELERSRWYVGGYKMSFEDPVSEEHLPLFHDMDAERMMFRIVIKKCMTRNMAYELLIAMEKTFLEMYNKQEDQPAPPGLGYSMSVH